ncbi:DUF5670 family protein [Anaeromyxobacter oryzisoli]|uniref:DUF5670 family protein n=1 Tax=Anaeromyxobacter oryzisoli TaxID=2925408 RepID=UPI001F57AEA8|nr:DUF5670 family protein [Anaeromyxobacter sp. SG63]
MLMLLATILALAWVIALAFKVTVGAIHLLLIAAVALYVIGFFRGRRGRATV